MKKLQIPITRIKKIIHTKPRRFTQAVEAMTQALNSEKFIELMKRDARTKMIKATMIPDKISKCD